MGGNYGVKWVVVHPINNWVFATTKYGYFGVVDFSSYYDQTSNYPLTFTLAGKYEDPTASEKYDMYIASDGKLLYMTCSG